MSAWSYIHSTIEMSTCIEENKQKFKKIVQEVVDRAPQITGGEGNADIFINIPSGYDTYISHDCKHCNYYLEGECVAKDGDSCIEGKYQTKVVITVCGSLRHRGLEQVKKEFKDFLSFIKKELKVFDYTGICRIEDISTTESFDVTNDLVQ